MATLSAEQLEAESQAVHWAVSEPAGGSPLPLLPWEDLYLYVKEIDNRRLERSADPALRRSYWRAIGTSLLAVLLLFAILLPAVLERVTAGRLAAAEREQHRLNVQLLELQREEAALLSPARLEEWARALQLMDPAPHQVHTLDRRSGHAVSAGVAELPASAVAR